MKSFSTILLTQHDKLRMLESAPSFFNFSWQKNHPNRLFFLYFIHLPHSHPFECSYCADNIYSDYCSCTSKGDYRLTLRYGTQSLPWKSGKEAHSLLNRGWHFCPSTDICSTLCHLILKSALQSLESGVKMPTGAGGRTRRRSTGLIPDFLLLKWLWPLHIDLKQEDSM